MGVEQSMVELISFFKNKNLVYAVTIAYAAAISLLSHQSNLPGPPSGAPFPGLDKLQHLILYTGFGVLAFASCAHAFRGSGGEVVLGFVFSMTFAALDELHQGMVPGRYADLGDWLADAVGIAAGFLIWSCWLQHNGFQGPRKRFYM